jgi:methylated-DNA-protein-cysteine methyltransferase related protein
MTATGTFARIWRVVRAIPRGRVMTYGEVARRAGLPRGARTVGRAMAASAAALPWQRVVGLRRAGTAHITIRDPLAAGLQRALLEQEGVRFGSGGAISLARFGARAAAPAGQRYKPSGREKKRC